MPSRFAEDVDLIASIPDRNDRIQALISIAERHQSPPHEVAVPPYPEEARVPACESEAFVFPVQRPDGTLDFHFAVLNPQGVSAMALSVMLRDGLSGAPLEQVASVEDDVVYRIFGRELSMGKSMGLTAMVAMVRRAAQQALNKRA